MSIRQIIATATQPPAVSQTPGLMLQRKCDSCGQHGVAGGGCSGCEKKKGSLQRRSSSGATARQVPPIVHEVLGSPGQPLDTVTRAFMEPHFGHDFSRVRVHTGDRAGESAASVNALAYTLGQHIVFAAHRYQPTTREGQHLLAHELTHVMQQDGLRMSAFADRLDQPGDPAEGEANSTAARLINGLRPSRIAPSSGTIQRQQPGSESQPDPVRPEGPARHVPYQVVPGDTLGGLAQRFGTTTTALRTINHLRNDSIRVGQLLQVPQISGCAITVPTEADIQIMAGAIFGEAEANRESNDEREAIAWAFLNSITHTRSLCDRSICPQLRDSTRRVQCQSERTNLGDTVLDTVRIGSRAFHGPRWGLVMSGNSMLPEGNLCLRLPAAEIMALRRAINTAAVALSSTMVPNNFIRFNRAANEPPSPRMERATAIAGHTFYRFIPDRECG